MKVEASFTLGGSHFKIEVEEKDTKEAMLLAAVLGNPPHYCHDCKEATEREQFRLDGNRDKEGNIYIKVTCKKCGAQASLGSYKGGGYFWKRFERYVPKGEDIPSRDVNSDIEPF